MHASDSGPTFYGNNVLVATSTRLKSSSRSKNPLEATMIDVLLYINALPYTNALITVEMRHYT